MLPPEGWNVQTWKPLPGANMHAVPHGIVLAAGGVQSCFAPKKLLTSTQLLAVLIR